MIYVVTVLGYLGLLVFIALRRARSVTTQDDFMVAGRSVPWQVLVGTLICTWIGSGSLFGGAGRAFREGFSALWMSAGAWVGIAVVFFLAARVRRIAEYTVPDLLERRYHPAARLLGTAAIAIAYLTIAGYQFVGGGRLLAILFPGLDPQVGMAIVAVLVTLFAVSAGMISVISLDMVNGIIIIVSIVIAAPLAFAGAGGIEGLTSVLPETHFTLTGRLGLSAAIGLFLPTMLLLLGESGMYQKFYAARSGAAARKAVVGMIVGVILIEVLIDATAVFAAAGYWDDPAFRTAAGFDTRATETVLLEFARQKLPVFAGCLLLAGAVAIIFSTATTFLLVPSTGMARDIYQRFLRPKADSRAVIRFQRFAMVGLSALALVITTRFESILDMALYAYTMVGAAVTPALLAAFLWRRASPMGGVISISAGIVTTVIFGVLNSAGVERVLFLPTDYDYVIYPAAVASISGLVVGSLLTAPARPEQVEAFLGSGSSDAGS